MCESTFLTKISFVDRGMTHYDYCWDIILVVTEWYGMTLKLLEKAILNILKYTYPQIHVRKNYINYIYIFLILLYCLLSFFLKKSLSLCIHHL